MKYPALYSYQADAKFIKIRARCSIAKHGKKMPYDSIIIESNRNGKCAICDTKFSKLEMCYIEREINMFYSRIRY